MRWLWTSGAPAVVRQARRLVIFVIGSTVVLLGAIMLITPGPAFIVIPAGLAILATEFVWARRLLRRMRDKAKETYDAAAKSWHKPDSPSKAKAIESEAPLESADEKEPS